MASFWLSFCSDSDLPEGSQFLGACIVPGDDVLSAVQAAHMLGCNPGGEVVGHPVPPGMDQYVEDRWRNRLMTRAECEQFDREMAIIYGKTQPN